MRTFCKKKVIPMLFILSLLLFPAVSIAEYVGSFSRIEGRVDLLRAGATSVVPVRPGDGVSMGDVIRTKSDGKAEILFKDDTTLTIASETRIKIDEYTFNTDKSRNKGRLSLLRGKVRAAVSKVKGGLIPVSLGSSTFNINTPTTVAGVRGTVFFVFFDKGVTGVVFKEGNGFVYNQNMPDKIVNVSAGQATFILKDDAPPLPPRPVSDVEMMQYIKDTTIDGGQTNNNNADTGVSLDQPGGGDVSGYNAPKTADTGVDPGPPPPVLPITETDTGTLKETAPPLITITSSPQAITNSSSGSFTITANEPVTFTYSMGSWGVTTTFTTSDTIILAGLPEGSHTLTITATDAAGNVSTSSYSWTTDYTVPASLALTGTPASITNINNATIVASATDLNGVTYSYTLDGSPSTGSLTGLGEGPHTFVATATDGAGNTSTTSYTWTTDYTAPTASISPAASPELTGATAAINVNFGSNETATYSYQLDGGGMNNVTGSSVNLTGIAEGTHTIDYSATDTAGNPSVTNSLSFALSRYSLSGSAGASGITGSITTGEVAGVSNQNWGGSKLVMSGSYSAMPPSFTLYAGGISSDATTTNNGGYWIDIISGTSDGLSSLSGTSGLKYLSYDRLGSGMGSFTGSYGAGTWSATDTGTYTETPLAFSGNIGFDSGRSELFYDGDGIMGTGHTDGGLLGGAVPSLSNPADVTYMGSYTATWTGPYMWTPIIYSGNAGTAFAPSYDNNKFWGYIGGVWEEGAIDGKIYSLYIDQNGNAGIIKGSVTGSYYPEITAYAASGAWSSQVGISTGLLQSDLTDLTNTPKNTWNGINSYSGTITGTDLINVWGAEGRRDSVPNQTWGIWQTMIAGTFDLPITAPFTDSQWDLATESYSYMAVSPFSVETITGTRTDGTSWTFNTGETIGRFAGTTLGYGADIKAATPTTWISVGETTGTFDPVATTWQGVQTGAWIDTNRFLAMTTADQAKLAALNIPFVEVGRANLTGTNSQWTINMNNTTFFAYSNGAAPKIWATGDVSGSYFCSACGPTPTLTGNGLSASLNMQTWDTTNNRWIATVSGSGTYSGTGSMNNSLVQFNGAAAGTNSGGIGGTFTGTGAGVAK